MKVKLTIELDEHERKAVARDRYADRAGRAASHAEVENWLREVIAEALSDITFTQLFEDSAQIDAFEPERNPGVKP